MKKFFIVLILAGVILLMLAGLFIKGLNVPVTLDERVNSAWAQIENQLQRRNDLIPNLINTVKGYMTYEQATFTRITELRSQWGKADTVKEKIDNANQMSEALSRLLLVVENYPELKANQNFLSLQAQLEGTENRIAVERMRYNEAVKAFNTYRRTVFGGLFCNLRGLREPRVYFEAAEAAKGVPEVKF